MLNILWPIFIILSFSYALLSGNIEAVNNSIFESAKSAIQFLISLLGTMCLWSGIMKIAEKTTLISKFTNLLNPFINFLFPEIKNNEKVKKEISMNITANILGLGNAATPLGIKAMKSLQEENTNKNSLSNPMAMLILINTASIQIIPTTAIAIRTSLGSSTATSIILPVWIATISAALAGITAVKCFIQLKK